MYSIAVIFLILLSSPCYAYLDGGSTSMFLQLIFGGLAGGIVFFKLYWRKLISFFKPKGQ